MPVMKLTVRVREGAEDSARAVQAVLLIAGGVVRAGKSAEELVHYLEQHKAAAAKFAWEEHGYTVVSSKIVATGSEGIARLLADLENESE